LKHDGNIIQYNNVSDNYIVYLLIKIIQINYIAMNDKQLYEKLSQNNYDKVFPITYLQNILDKDTNNNLTVVLSRFNHLWIPYQGTRVNTRKAVPAIFRRNSLTISYYDAEHNISVTESYIGSNMQAGVEASWVSDDNWTKILSEKYLEESGAKIPIADGTIDWNMLNEALKQMIAADGKVTIINYPDEEDITLRLTPGCCNVNRLSLKDRHYEPEYKSGKGYKIIRRVLLPVEDEIYNVEHLPFDGFLNDTYCEQYGQIILNTDNYEVIDIDLGNTAGVYYDTYHKLFVLRVKTSEDGVGFYNYYTRWTIVEATDRVKPRAVINYGSSDDYNVYNTCLSDERPRLNVIYVNNIDYIKYYFNNEDLVQVKNNIYLHYKSVLTQDMLNEENTRYIIRYAFDLNSKTITMPSGCELVFEGGIIENGTIDLNKCKLTGMVGEESEYLPNVTCSNWAKGQIEYRNGKICYWNGTEWRVIGDVSSFDSYTKQEINNLLKNYYTKSETYNKEEVNNLLNRYVTNDTFNNFKEEINQTITNSVNLDKIQKAINDGCGVNMTMPSANSNKLSLPIWTGTATQYATITPVAGMTYNIIDE
jgi:hypothetical protein